MAHKDNGKYKVPVCRIYNSLSFNEGRDEDLLRFGRVAWLAAFKAKLNDGKELNDAINELLKDEPDSTNRKRLKARWVRDLKKLDEDEGVNTPKEEDDTENDSTDDNADKAEQEGFFESLRNARDQAAVNSGLGVVPSK